MKRDRIAICKIISEMLDDPDEIGIYQTGRCFDRLEKYIEAERIQAIGWMHAEACTTLDSGSDIRETEISGMLERAERDLDLVPTNDELFL